MVPAILFYIIFTDRMPPWDLTHKVHLKFKINFYYSKNDQNIPKAYANKFSMAIIQARSNNNPKVSQKVRIPVTKNNSTIKIALFNEKILKKNSVS